MGAHDRPLLFCSAEDLRSGRRGCEICGWMSLTLIAHALQSHDSVLLLQMLLITFFLPVSHLLYFNLIGFLLWDSCFVLRHGRETAVN